MTEANSTLAAPATHGFRRDQFCRDLLLDIARDDPDVISQDFTREITLSSILSDSRRRKDYVHTDTLDLTDADSEWTGVLPEDDILRFGLLSPRSEVLQLGSGAQQRLEEELDKLLLSITEFFHADVGWENLGEEEQHALAWTLPQSIESYKDSTASTRSEVNEAYQRIGDLVKLLGETHGRLQADLAKAAVEHPPEINGRRSASNELLAARIEASLIKLSLMRARATRALYDHRAPKNPDATMAQALAAAYAKLKVDERKMMEEEAALNRQLLEYETMLKLVDGSSGGFVQIIEDWTRVQKEREECIRDLRRLGWTGD